ncbi:MAG TPA: ABC transporter ATP-binding protein [Sphaerochaeta sp.]|nr:ABC transporter ATP-binding protein [Sphaerochaeta sp.]
MSRITLQQVAAGYTDTLLFDALNLKIPSGKFIALTGPNGSGKSTLLKLLYKELKPQKGVIYLDGDDISGMRQKHLAQGMGFVPQHAQPTYAFTVEEAVAMGRYAHHNGDDTEAVAEALSACCLTDMAETLITTLSGGELQRVYLARALAQGGKLLLLDEPVNHLDVKHQRSIMDQLTRLASDGYTVICVLHDLFLAQIYSEYTIMLSEGAVYRAGATEEVFSRETLQAVYQIDAYQVHDPVLNRSFWMPHYRSD